MRWSDKRLVPGWLVLLLAAAVYVAFFPKLLLNGDEYFYAGEARMLANGHLVPVAGDGLPFPVWSVGDSLKYPLGWPLLLAAGRAVSVRGMWCVALLVHLLGGAAFSRLLVRRGLPAWANVVWLFHPVAWLYSRTVLSDVPAAAALLVAIDAWENRDRLVAAVALALLPGMRVANLLVFPGFAVAAIREVRARRGDAITCTLAVLAALVFQVAMQRALIGHWLGPKYVSGNASLIGPGMVLENAGLYLAGLALLPPFVLAFALARPRQVERWVWVAAPVFAFLLVYRYHDEGNGWLQTLVGGQRLLLPAHAALLVATARLWTRPWPFSSPRWLVVAGCAMAIAISFGMRRLEARFVAAWEIVQACRPSTIGYTVSAGRVALAADADRYVAMDRHTGDVTSVELLLVGTRYESHRPGPELEERSAPQIPAGHRCVEVGAYRIIDIAGRCPTTVHSACDSASEP